MKNTDVFVIVLFLLINTSYYWEGKLGFYAIPFFLLLLFIYLALVIVLGRRFYLATKKDFADKRELYSIGSIAVVLGLIFYYPRGIINFDKLQGDDVLIAQREGAANCGISIKLKNNFSYKQKTVCFGIKEIKGRFRLQHDTVYFNKPKLAGVQDEFYSFAVVKPVIYGADADFTAFVMYKNRWDTVGVKLEVVKNELYKLKELK